jgi:hypothetical protein
MVQEVDIIVKIYMCVIILETLFAKFVYSTTRQTTFPFIMVLLVQ